MAAKHNQWKPTARIKTNEYGKTTHDTKEFPTYRLLVKNMKLLLAESIDNKVFVSRSKRGEWGEWFEIWQKSGGVSEIVKQGWM